MKKLLMFTLIPLVLSVMVSPTIAIGPQKAEKNPNTVPMPDRAMLRLPGGVQNEWMTDIESGVIDFIHILNASKGKGKAKIRAVPLTIDNLIGIFTIPEVALEVENEWGYIPHDVFVVLLQLMMGLSPQEAEVYAAAWPEGMYVMFVNVGK